MSDFYQSGSVATFHRLRIDLDRIEEDLARFSGERRVSLVLPSLYSEINGPGLKRIVAELSGIRYIREIVLSLGPCNGYQFQKMKTFLSVLPQKVTVIWNSGPRMQALYEELRQLGLDPGPDGKGLNVWIAYGYVLAEKGSQVICLHDCDIVTYNRELLARLIYPVLSPSMSFEFCKGFYARFTDKLNGRVTRLFVTPLLRALQSMTGFSPILRYFDSFRYALAGEFAMTTHLASLNRIPSDWGLEVGMLAEAYRNTSLSRICQSELCENYDHKHQSLSTEDPCRGLNKMAIDIAKSLFRTLSSEGVVFQPSFYSTLWSNYRKIAQDMINRFDGDAAINGLDYSRHDEESALEMFVGGIRSAGEAIAADPVGPPAMPNWARVFSAIPDFGEKLIDTIASDNLEERRIALHVKETGHF